jgi:hypothetical protein
MTRLTFPICQFLWGMTWGTETYELLRAISPDVVVGTTWPDTGRIHVLIAPVTDVIRAIQMEVQIEASEELKARVVAEPPYTIERFVTDFPMDDIQVRKVGRSWRALTGAAVAVESTLSAALLDVREQLRQMRPRKATGKPLTTEKPKRGGRDD